MKMLTVLLLALASLLSGCVVYDTPRRYDDQHRWHRDSDRDGVPDRQDRRPADPYRY